MPKANLPHFSEAVLNNINNFTGSWSKFFQELKLRIGADKEYSLGGTLAVNTTAVGNVDGGEDNLITYSMEKNTLLNLGDFIEIEAFGTFANNTNSKTVKLYLGTTVVFSVVGTTAFQNVDWHLKSTIIRTTATTQKIISTITVSGALATDYVEAAEDFATALTIKCTGTSGSAATDDIIQKGLIIKQFPSN